MLKNKLKKSLSAGRQGFTLIELLVVIAIIGILSSVVLVSLNSARIKARDAKRISDIGSIQQALALYFDSNGRYPDAATVFADLVTAKLLPVAPAAPLAGTGEVYKYSLASNNLSYHLGASLEGVALATGVLATDNDCNSNTNPSTCNNWPAAAPSAGAFNGADVANTNCDSTTSTGASCYDVTP